MDTRHIELRYNMDNMDPEHQIRTTDTTSPQTFASRQLLVLESPGSCASLRCMLTNVIEMQIALNNSLVAERQAT